MQKPKQHKTHTSVTSRGLTRMAKRTTAPAPASLFQASVFQLKNVTPHSFLSHSPKILPLEKLLLYSPLSPKMPLFYLLFPSCFCFLFLFLPSCQPSQREKMEGPLKIGKVENLQKEEKTNKKKENDGRKVRGACLHDVGGMGGR